jgi:hypothetical protein
MLPIVCQTYADFARGSTSSAFAARRAAAWYSFSKSLAKLVAMNFPPALDEQHVVVFDDLFCIGEIDAAHFPKPEYHDNARSRHFIEGFEGWESPIG